ncbi:MAG: hypothetical protein K8R68_05310 [Bacteroidales bacterium]|nr:hypothetical protein [Bacteroidales bacterium]
MEFLLSGILRLTTQGYVVIYSELMAQGNTITSYGDIDIGGGGGVLNINENAVLEMADNKWLAINMNSTLEVIGSPGNEATITHTTGHYTFWIGNGATISAEHAVFEYMGMEGIWLHPGAMVDPAHPFDNCTFKNGIADGRLLTINSNQSFTATNAIFPANTWGGAYNVYKDVDEGTVNFTNSTGAFSGESYDYDPFNRIHWGVPSLTFDLKVFLEGPFDPATNEMTTKLNTILPTSQPYYPTLPYFGNPSPDWYYGGSESVGSIPNPQIVDWIVVQLREGIGPGTATNILATQAAFINHLGDVVGLDGFSSLNFSITYSNNLYAVIWHKNHLGVISANPLVDVGGLFTYDFSSGSGQAYGGTSAQKQLATGIWGLISGDGDGDGEIQLSDKVNVWELQAGRAGYLEGDYILNGEVSNQDKDDYWLPNLGSSSYIP